MFPNARSAGIILILLVPFIVFASEPAGLEEYAPEDMRIEQEAPADPVMSASGDVLFIGDGESQDVYIVLGSESERSYDLGVGELVQGAVRIGIPVEWTQNLTIVTDENVTINLWNHEESIPHTFLSDVIEMEIVFEGEVISEVPIMTVPAGSWNLTITYRTAPVHREIVCEKQTVADLLPPGATLISADIPLDTYVQEVCRIRLFHESHTPYSDVSFEVDEIDRDSIVSIYSVEHDRYLYLKEDSLYIPRR